MVVRRRHTGRSTATVIGAFATGTVAIGAMLALPAQAASESPSATADSSCSSGSPTSTPASDPVSPAADAASGGASASADASDGGKAPADASDTPTPTPSPCATSDSASASPSPSDSGSDGSGSPSAPPTPSGSVTHSSPPVVVPPSLNTTLPPAQPPSSSPFYTPPPTQPGPDGSGDVTVIQTPGAGNPYSYLSVPPGDSSLRLPHGTITRAQILQRAQRWITESVPYSQSAWWRDAGGIYRQDCSGYVSMAWALDQTVDFWTGNLNTVSHTIDPSQLLPGDILLSQEHTVLFAGWADAAHTEFDYYEESHPGTDARFVVDAPIADFLSSGFAAFRYDGVSGADSGLPANPVQGLDFNSLQAGGSELMPNGILTSAPPVASWQAGFLPPSIAAKVSTAAQQPAMKPVADVTSIEPPLGYVLASGGMVFVVAGAVIARGAPRVASTARSQRRRH